MSWATPRTWLTSETMTSTIFNQHVRDNVSVLKTKMNFDAVIGQTLYSAEGAFGNSGTGETTLSSTWTLNPNEIADGKGLHWWAWGSFAANVNQKTVKLYTGASSYLTAWNNYNTSVANNLFTVNLTSVRSDETANKVRWFGYVTYGAATGAAPTIVHFVAANTSGAMDWTATNTLKITGQSNTASNDIVLSGILVKFIL